MNRAAAPLAGASNESFRVELAPTNPGCFYACCGLLELADRLWNGAEGWFEGDAFLLRAVQEGVDASPARLMRELAACKLSNTMTPEEKSRLETLREKKAKDLRAEEVDEKKELEGMQRTYPLMLPAPFDLRIDWFLDDRSGGSRFKTWAGQQSVQEIALAMKSPIDAGGWTESPPADWLRRFGGDDGLPFNFDADLGAQASALDVGFSLDPLGMKTKTRPLVEFAAFVGLQRFRPQPAERNENRYGYTLWNVPMPPLAASIAAGGRLVEPLGRPSEFRLLYRTKYLKSFLPAKPIRGGA